MSAEKFEDQLFWKIKDDEEQGHEKQDLEKQDEYRKVGIAFTRSGLSERPATCRLIIEFCRCRSTFEDRMTRMRISRTLKRRSDRSRSKISTADRPIGYST